MKAAGKARAIGVSNYTEAHIEEIRAAGLPLPEYN
jgi:2,5-diketo-D-gluconate reductase A